jgi:hypothetical protein
MVIVVTTVVNTCTSVPIPVVVAVPYHILMVNAFMIFEIVTSVIIMPEPWIHFAYNYFVSGIKIKISIAFRKLR